MSSLERAHQQGHGRLTSRRAAPSTVEIKLRARSSPGDSVNGFVEDEGTIVNSVGDGANLTSPNDANLPPLKAIMAPVRP
ncbi:MAG TPA: hypothetical protein VIT88_02225 [Pyrinomonadaceae bacterium]